MISQLQESVFVGETGNFRVEDQWFDLTLDAEVIACPETSGMGFPQPLDLDFPDGI